MTDALSPAGALDASGPVRSDTSPVLRHPAAAEVFEVVYAHDRAAALVIPGSAFVGRATVPLVEVFTAAEQRARTSQAYYRSAVGERLRVMSVDREDDATARRTLVAQYDEVSGILTRTVITQPHGIAAVRVETDVRNDSDAPLVVTAVSSLNLGFGTSEPDLDDVLLAVADSEWLAENRWREVDLRGELPDISLSLHGQDGRGHYGLSSHGAWSSGEHLPCGILTSARSGRSVAWQIETSAGWHVDLSQAMDGGVLSLLGPSDVEHHFARELAPGEVFTAVPVAVATAHGGRDAAIAALTAYRRWLRRAHRGAPLPVVYNDFMNTLMGQPSTELLLPLIGSAADAGAEVFCIDAGWFAEPELGDWWSTVGEWQEARSRFTGGLSQVTGEIIARGMRVGLWLEPEVVGADSPAAAFLPKEAFFHRHGRRVMENHRYHLDFRHPAARAHMDEVVDRVVEQYDVSFLKLDYNINPGVGTERDATTAGDGLLGHSRAFRAWLLEIQARHPGLTLENCSSGAMRADYALLEVTHMQSTSDQQDFRLYPPIAASAPVSILPEQCGNWAYPSVDMTIEETAFTLVSGLSGRLYLSGFLHRLTDEQRSLTAHAVALHKDLRPELDTAVPFWPLGLPAWDADTVCLGYHLDGRDLLFVWDRHPEPRTIVVPEVWGEAEQIFPPDRAWPATAAADGLQVSTGPGVGARVFLVHVTAEVSA